MLLPRYGIKTAIIGIGEYLVKCPSCESHNWADVMVVSNYYHFTYIPMFPMYKDATVYCKKCGLRRNGVPFNTTLIPDYSEIKKLYRNPWYTYIGISIAVSFIVLCLIVAAIRAFS